MTLTRAGLVACFLLTALTWQAVHAQSENPTAQGEDAKLDRVASLAPDESLNTLAALDGFRVELIAAEPLIADPVAIAFDAQGRMFVVCTAAGTQGGGEVRLLEDSDADGRFDTGGVFADALFAPSSVTCYDAGVFVVGVPDLVYLKDTDGDGKADVRKTIFTGFNGGENESWPNSLRWGLENRIHGAPASLGGRIRSAGSTNAVPVDVTGFDFAFDPRTRSFALTAGGGVYGSFTDNWGRKFVATSRNSVEMVLLDVRYHDRDEVLGDRKTWKLFDSEGFQGKVYTQSPAEPWEAFHRASKSRQSSGQEKNPARVDLEHVSCLAVYRGDSLHRKFRSQIFIGDARNNLIHRKGLAPENIALRGYRNDREKEFLASEEIWFRPRQITNGPDGNLYVVDTHREVFAPPSDLPSTIARQLPTTSGHDLGRIYRIVPDDFKDRAQPRLNIASTDELVATLEHTNGWHRDTASRLLYERQDPAAIQPLKTLLREGTTAWGRLHALYALQGLGALEVDSLLVALSDEHGRVKTHAVLLAEPRLNAEAKIREALYALVEDRDQQLRYQVALSLGECADDGRYAPLGELLKRDAWDEWMRAAVFSSLPTGGDQVFSYIVSDADYRRRIYAKELENYRDMVVALASHIGNRQNTKEIAAVLKVVEAMPQRDQRLAESIVLDLLHGLGRTGAELRTFLSSNSEDADQFMDDLLSKTRDVVFNREYRGAARAASVRTLSLSSWEVEGARLTELLDYREPVAVQLAVLEVLSGFNSLEADLAILQRWNMYTPGFRDRAIESLCTRPEGQSALLDAIESDQIDPATIHRVRRDFLKTKTDPAIRKSAKRILAQDRSDARTDVVEAYRSALSLEGDRKRGMKIFETACSGCHDASGEGDRVGPRISAIRDLGAEGILFGVLDPNRDINPDMLAYNVLATNGDVMRGVIPKEGEFDVDMFRELGQHLTVPRKQLERLECSNDSFMPEGFERQIDQQAMADLLAYILSSK